MVEDIYLESVARYAEQHGISFDAALEEIKEAEKNKGKGRL